MATTFGALRFYDKKPFLGSSIGSHHSTSGAFHIDEIGQNDQFDELPSKVHSVFKKCTTSMVLFRCARESNFCFIVYVLHTWSIHSSVRETYKAIYITHRHFSVFKSTQLIADHYCLTFCIRTTQEDENYRVAMWLYRAAFSFRSPSIP